MPSWPIEMPSETEMVPNWSGKPPASNDAVLGPQGQPLEREVARRDLVPAGGHADLRLVPVVVRHADGAEHGPGGRLLHAGGDVVRAWLQVGHGGTLPRVCATGPGGHTAGVVVVLALLAGAAWAALTWVGDHGRQLVNAGAWWWGWLAIPIVAALLGVLVRRRDRGPGPWLLAVPPAGPDGHRLRGPRSPGRPPTGLLAGRLDPPRGPRRPLHGGRSIPPRLELTAGG